MTSEIKNRTKSKEKVKATYAEASFINHTFDEGTKARFKAWAETNQPFMGDAIDKLVEAGYRLTVKYDSYSDAYAAFIQASVGGGDNDGLILTGRGRCGSMAILGALYRHFVLWEGQWPNDVVRKNGMDDE